MNENQLAKNIMYYRKKKGLSQEKVAEYLGVSRQAVTKWENDMSKPNSTHLIKLAQLLEVSVDELLNNEKRDELFIQTRISTGKTPWIFIVLSALCILFYSILSNTLNVGLLICLFVFCVPIQLFLHVYFSYAINNDSFSGIAEFNDKIEYNINEVKKMLGQIDLHLNMMTTVYIFLLCIINGIDIKIEWINSFLIVTYLFNFIITVIIHNYQMIDKIYRRDSDKKRAKCSTLVGIIYSLVLLIGIGLTVIIFDIKEIENNTMPAIKIGGVLLLAIFIATIGLVLENKQIKNEDIISYKINKVSMICLFICVIIYGLMCFI